MSVRDEMANLLRGLPVDALPCDQARALMPIVERFRDEAVAAHRDNQIAMQATINAQEAEIFDLKNQLRRANERMEALQRMFLGA